MCAHLRRVGFKFDHQRLQTLRRVRRKRNLSWGRGDGTPQNRPPLPRSLSSGVRIVQGVSSRSGVHLSERQRYDVARRPPVALTLEFGLARAGRGEHRYSGRHLRSGWARWGVGRAPMSRSALTISRSWRRKWGTSSRSEVRTPNSGAQTPTGNHQRKFGGGRCNWLGGWCTGHPACVILLCIEGVSSPLKQPNSIPPRPATNQGWG